MKKTIVFDLGGVLIDWDPRYLYRQIFSDQEELDFFLSEVCSPEWNALTDSDKSFQDAIEDLIPQFPEYKDQIQVYFSRWEEMVAGPISGSIEILGKLYKNKYPLAALSNWSSETFPIVHAKYEFLDWFDPLIISGQVGLIKPDPQIFNLLLCQLDQDPEECVYIDDLESNIQAASKIGFRTILYQSPEHLQAQLHALDVVLD